MTAPSPERPRRIDALDVPLEQVEAESLQLLAGRITDPELRHQFLDLDPDSTCCPDGFTCPACPPDTGGAQ